jgi:hypothetical protein
MELMNSFQLTASVTKTAIKPPLEIGLKHGDRKDGESGI